MIVYDIIQEVKPGAICSYQPGRWHVGHHDDEAHARQQAELFNRCCRVAGVTYGVEAIDEESPERCVRA